MSKKYQTIKSHSNSKIYAFVIIIAVALICVGVGIIMFASNLGIENVNANSEVSTDVGISDEDIVVNIQNDGRINELTVIQISVSGINLVENVAYKNVPKGGGTIVFSEVGRGIKGDRSVLVRGYFSDGSDSILIVKSVNFG